MRILKNSEYCHADVCTCCNRALSANITKKSCSSVTLLLWVFQFMWGRFKSPISINFLFLFCELTIATTNPSSAGL